MCQRSKILHPSRRTDPSPRTPVSPSRILHALPCAFRCLPVGPPFLSLVTLLTQPAFAPQPTQTPTLFPTRKPVSGTSPTLRTSGPARGAHGSSLKNCLTRPRSRSAPRNVILMALALTRLRSICYVRMRPVLAFPLNRPYLILFASRYFLVR